MATLIGIVLALALAKKFGLLKLLMNGNGQIQKDVTDLKDHYNHELSDKLDRMFAELEKQHQAHEKQLEHLSKVVYILEDVKTLMKK